LIPHVNTLGAYLASRRGYIARPACILYMYISAGCFFVCVRVCVCICIMCNISFSLAEC